MCKRNHGAFKELGSCETKYAAEGIQRAALIREDDKLMAKILGIDLIAKEAKYHHSCKRAYLLAAERTKNQASGESINSTSFNAICSYVEKFVISVRRPELLTSLYTRYVIFCEDCNETPYSTAQYLMQKLQQKFTDGIKIQSPLGKKTGVIVYPSSVADDAAGVA